MNVHPIEFEPRGFYEPGVFHLRVNNCEDLSELNRLHEADAPSAWRSTFLHEYVHFLQDITTTHGLLNLVFFIEELKNANKMILDGPAQFRIPLELSNTFNFDTNVKLFGVYYGCRDDSMHPVSATYKRYSKEEEVIYSNKNEAYHVPKYAITYANTDGDEDSYHFGSRQIKEYMAHAIQSEFAPEDASDHPDIPYRLVEMIVEREVPRVAKSRHFLTALCDASLMDFNPAHLFFYSLERMKNCPDWQPTDVDSIYEFVFNGVTPSFNGTMGFQNLFEDQINRAVSAFVDSLRADVFKNNVTWFTSIVLEAKKLRCAKRGFVTKLVSSEGVFSEHLFEIIRRLGVPFTTNAASEGCFVPPAKLAGLKIEPYYPKVFQAIRNTFHGVMKCSLLPMCEANPNQQITNCDCSNKPWTRVSLPYLCPYAQMWKSWGLIGKMPQVAH